MSSSNAPRDPNDVPPNYLTCPQCGYFNHPAATVRDDDRYSCNNCFHLFLPKESE